MEDELEDSCCSSDPRGRPLYRSRSLPHLPSRGRGQQKVVDVRQLLTLKQHYYPEGGWGWVVVVVGVLVQLLSHGMHVASGVLVGETVRRFGKDIAVPAGKYYNQVCNTEFRTGRVIQKTHRKVCIEKIIDNIKEYHVSRTDGNISVRINLTTKGLQKETHQCRMGDCEK